jgi:hypothetical protein
MTISIMANVHQSDRPFPLRSGIILLKYPIIYIEMPANKSIKKLTKGSITSQSMENPVK